MRLSTLLLLLITIPRVIKNDGLRSISQKNTNFRGWITASGSATTTSMTAKTLAVDPGSQNIKKGPRNVLGILSFLGTIETGYLTVEKFILRGSNLASVHSALSLCGNDCGSVLQGPWSNVPFINVPLASVGLLAYLSVFLLATVPILRSKSGPLELDFNEHLLVVLTTSMAAGSVCLMWVLLVVLKERCNFCCFSAGLSFSMAMVSWVSIIPRAKDQVIRTFAFKPATIVSILFLASSIFANPLSATASSTPPGIREKIDTNISDQTFASKSPPVVKTVSSEKSLNLAKRIKDLDGTMYGAYWCSHCNNQKKILGSEAMKIVGYVECDTDGMNSRKALCLEKQIRGYPTWELDGNLFPGEKNIDELDKLVSQVESQSGLQKAITAYENSHFYKTN